MELAFYLGKQTLSIMNKEIIYCYRKTFYKKKGSKKIKPVNTKEINPEYSLKGLMLKLKLQYFGYLMQRTDSLEKTQCWEKLRAKEGGNIG